MSLALDRSGEETSQIFLSESLLQVIEMLVY